MKVPFIILHGGNKKRETNQSDVKSGFDESNQALDPKLNVRVHTNMIHALLGYTYVRYISSRHCTYNCSTK